MKKEHDLNEREMKLVKLLFVKSFIKEEFSYLFGSDAHNLSDRKPNWDLLKKKVRTDVMDGAEVIL